MARRIEIGLGALTAALTIGGIVLAVFGPATYRTDVSSAGSVSVWDNGIDTVNVLLYLAAMIVAAALVATGTYARGHGGTRTALTVIWTGALVLVLGMLVTFPGNTTAVVPTALHTDTPDSVGIGVYFLPAAAAAIATALAESLSHHAPRRPVSLTPH